MPIHTPIYTFGSIAEANGSVIKSGILWRVLGADGVVCAAGLGAGVAIYPAQTGAVLATPNIDASATTGYEILSGTVTAVLVAGGAAYTDNDVLTVVGGTILLGDGTTVGTAMTFVATVVAGEVTSITPSAGTAGHGDYVILPDTTAAVATTGGTGTGCTVTLTQAATGFSLDGSNQWVCNPKRTAGTPSCVNIRLPVMNQGAAGWWFPAAVGMNFVVDALDQITVDAADFELATAIRIRVERLASLDGTAWGDGVFGANNGADWKCGVQRDDLTQVVGAVAHATAAADELALEYVQFARSVGFPAVLAGVSDRGSATKMDPVATVGAPLLISSVPYRLEETDSETVDRAFISLIFYAGPTANDEQTYTVTSVYGRDTGWEERA